MKTRRTARWPARRATVQTATRPHPEPADGRDHGRSALGVVARPGGWPYRWCLPPLAVAASGWALAAAGTLRLGLGVPLAVFAVTAGVAGLWGWRGLTRRSDRIWLAMAAVSLAGWLPAAVLAGPWQGEVMFVFVVGTVTLSVPLWVHPWTRRRVRTAENLRDWPQMAATLGVPGAILHGIEHTRMGRRFLIELVGGQTWRALRAETAESVLDVAPGAVSVERDLRSARRVVMHVQDADPWADGAVPHPVLAAIDAAEAMGADPTGKQARRLTRDKRLAAAVATWRAGTGTVHEPIQIGVRPDAEPAALPVWMRTIGALHWVIAGMTGAGKTVFLRDLIAGLARCRDVEIWGIDTRKGGKAFTPWAPVMARIARTLPEAVVMLRGARDLVTASAADAARAAEVGEGSDNVEPSPTQPLVVIVVDEAADLLDVTVANPRTDDGRARLEAVELAEGIMAGARSEAVSIVLATQRPDNASLGGSSKLRSHCTVGVCLRMRQAHDIKFALQGPAVDELDVSLFRHPGLLYAQVGPDTVPVPIRDYALLTPADARRVADYLAPGMTRHRRPTGNDPAIPTTPLEPAMPNHDAPRPQVDPDLLSRIHAYAEVAEADPPSDAPKIPLDQLAALHEAAEVTEPGDEDAIGRILTALANAGTTGMRRADLDAAVDLSSATVQRLLAALERAGRVVGGQGTGRDVTWRVTATAESTDASVAE